MDERLPQLRHDISIDVHVEEGQQYLVLSDTFGIADGPIMVHADMVDILDACTGEMTWQHLADAAGVDVDSPQIMQVRAFLRQLDDLGYFDTPAFEQRRTSFHEEWGASPIRPAVCAGSTYPESKDELIPFLRDVMGLPHSQDVTGSQGVKESGSTEVREPESQEVREPKSQEVREPKSQEVREPESQEVREPESQEVRESVSQDVHNVSHAVSHAVSHNVSHTVSHAVSHTVSHVVSHAVSHNVSHNVSHAVSHAVSHEVSHAVSHAVLAPHIDFRVAPHVYAPAMEVIAESDADLIVMIGTSHYWGNDALVLTEKHFETPLGIVETDVELVRRLTVELGGLVSTSDVAHKPEHALELHVVCAQYVRAGRPFRILPILVTGLALEGDALDRAAAAIRQVLQERGERYAVMISGDLAHVGHRFGDDLPAAAMLPDVKDADRALIAHLEAGNTAAYADLLSSTDNAFRVCGHAPTLLALKTFNPKQGRMLAYDVWDDAPTKSAVTFVTMRFETH